MKSGLIVVLFRLFTIGVFVGGKESNGELVSVMEGDSVTLMSGVTEIQADDEIEWEFNGSLLATISIDSGKLSEWIEPDGPFRNRLQLDSQTGDLKISNIKTTDSGPYKPTISSPRGSPEMAFTVNVVSADEVKLVSVIVNVGDSVTLRPDPTYIQGYDVIRWRFGQQTSSVAEINRMGRNFIRYDGPDERFRDRLTLNNQTGSLTITDIRTTDAGLYEAEISSTRSSYTMHYTQSFNVTVSGEMKTVSVKEGESVTLQINVTKIQSDDLIVWMFGNINLAEFNKTGKLFTTSDVPDRRFRLRLDLDHQSGSLIITDTRTTDSGDYQLKIISSRHIINRRITVTVSGVFGESVSVKEGDSVTLSPELSEIKKDDVIDWRFRDSLIARVRNNNNPSVYEDALDGTFRDRLKLNGQTGDLTITNFRNTDAGDYEVSNSINTFKKTFSVSGSGVQSGSDLQSGSGLSPGVEAGIVVAVVGLLAAAGFVYYRRKISKLESQMEENERNLKQKTDDPVTEETKLDDPLNREQR